MLDTMAASTSVAKRMEPFVVEIGFRSPEQMAEIIRSDLPRYARAIKLSGAKAE